MILEGSGLLLFILFIAIRVTLWRSRDFVAHRRLTGYEIARYLLDQAGLSHFAIQTGKSDGAVRANHFLLEPQFAESKTLLAFCRISQQVLFSAKCSTSILSSGFRYFWAVADILIFAAWIFLLLSLLNPAWIFLREIAWGILVGSEMAALFEFSDMISVNRKAYSSLKESGFFEIDELVRMRRILRVLRWEGFVRIFKAPCDLILSLMPNRKLY